MTIRDAALAYAAQGWPVLALFTARDGACLCSSGADCKSPGKHPRPDLSPNGVKNATLDAAVIAAWPDDINIGVALGSVAGGVMAFDVDDSEVANKLLHPDVGLSDQTGVVFTGRRGCHIWVNCIGSTNTFYLNHEEGGKIGEMRGDGAYVVVPPSTAATGRQYRWVGRRRVELAVKLERIADPAGWVKDLLLSVGVKSKVAGQAMAATIRPPEDAIYPLDIPDAIRRDSRLTDYRQILKGSIKSGQDDRSGRIYSLACSLAEVSVARNYPIKPEEIAGVLKKFDGIAFNVPKYAGRSDADEQYWVTANRALSSIMANTPPPDAAASGAIATATATATAAPTAPPVPASIVPADYFWDEADGYLYYRSARSVKRVANFKPEIIEDIEVFYGDGADKETERAWRVIFTLAGGRTFEFQTSWNDPKGSLAHVLLKSCPSEFVVSASMYEHIRAALQELSNAKPKRVFATTGWVEHGDRWLYLLPGCPGAITADGFDMSVRIDLEYMPEAAKPTFEQLLGYGQGVRPPANASERETAWNAFAALVEAGPVAKTLPIVLQVLAGPLASAGVREVPPLIHVMGKTGSMKTSYCLAAISLFGTFSDTTPPPASWSSTTNYLAVMLHRAKDLTLLVDDYKRGVASSKREVSRLVQNYADGTARGRATREGEGQVTKVPRALLLSNGEDVWESEASATARTLVIDLSRGSIQREGLTRVQSAVKAGDLQRFGGAFLTWMAGQTALLDGSELPQIQQRWREKLMDYGKADIHLRLMSSLSTLLAVYEVLGRFVAEVYGVERAEQVKQWAQQATEVLVGAVHESAVEIEEGSPLQQLIRAIATDMSVGKACLLNAMNSRTRRPDKPRAEVVGFYYPDGEGAPESVLLTREMTFQWFERNAARRWDDVAFSWNAVLREADSIDGGGRARNRRIYSDRGETQLSGISVPYALFSQNETSQ